MKRIDQEATTKGLIPMSSEQQVHSLSRWQKTILVAIAVVAVISLVTQVISLVTLDKTVEAAKPSDVHTYVDLPTADCFWNGPVTGEQFPYADFPDYGAAYWLAKFTVPPGAHLTLSSDFPYARYASLNAYNQSGVPTDSLNDVDFKSDPGVQNPFIVGNPRFNDERGYSVSIANSIAPDKDSQRAPGTIYARDGKSFEAQLIYRIYVPNEGANLQGNVPLPAPTIKLSDGSSATGQDACVALNANPTSVLPNIVVGKVAYEVLESQPGVVPWFPAQNPTAWFKYFNIQASLKCDFKTCPSTAAKSPGLYSNGPSSYVTGQINNLIGDVLVFQGKMPTFPQTYDGDNSVMTEGQVRYWSMCMNESVATAATSGCLSDYQVPLDADGNFTIVMSAEEARPSNANATCGVGWLEWSPNGNGIGNENAALLILRNLLSNPNFKQSINNITAPSNAAVAQQMGAYYPVSTYTNTENFEARGCASP